MRDYETPEMVKARHAYQGPDHSEIEEQEIEHQIEYFEECQRGEHGPDLEWYTNCYGTLKNYDVYMKTLRKNKVDSLGKIQRESNEVFAEPVYS
tara:strand:+ start:130 stop:411 length:282 start_codon:yes stop_codon:yes gene_type:complete